MNNNYKNRRTQTLLILFICGLFCVPNLRAQFTITENFKGSTVGSNIILGGSPNRAFLTSGISDPVNQGWLRLTTDVTNQKGFAYIDTSFPSSLGVYIEFEYKSWRTTEIKDYKGGADGFSVFLFDANTKNFSIGAYGGSLGYAQLTNGGTTNPGLSGGYIGVGFDEYGNYAMSSEGKNGGTSALAPNSVVLRGTANTTLPYRYLAHAQLQTSDTKDGETSLDHNSIVRSRPTDETFYRKVKIYLEPAGNASEHKYRVRVLWRTTPEGADVNILDYITSDPIPASLKMGFGSSTGGGVNFHEIRNIFITTPSGVRAAKKANKENVIVGEEITYTIDMFNETSLKFNNIALSDTVFLNDGTIVPKTDFEVTSITFDNGGYAGNTASGFTSGTAKTTNLTNVFSSKLTLEANSSSKFIVKGKVHKMITGGVLTNIVDLNTSNSGFKDNDLTNNRAFVVTTVLNPNVDLRVEKTVDNNGIAKATGNIYTILVSNMSTTNKPNNTSDQVIVKDTIPTGLTVESYTATGWIVSNTGNIYTFSRSDVLNSQYSYPPIQITVKPSVGGPWLNTAHLTYAKDLNLNNNQSSINLKWLNYWRGSVDSDWAKKGNWTANCIPLSGEHIEFATEANNGSEGIGNGTGAAINNLLLDKDRTIGNLINNSDKDLWITTNNKLLIEGGVQDADANSGTIVVKADPNKATGTLLFADPLRNASVNATVEFYNKAYKCDDCGFYPKQWQYFGIPITASNFPYQTSRPETVNQWVESYTYSNKWQLAPYNQDLTLKAFKGYEITYNMTTLPTYIYSFSGLLNIGDASIPLTKTVNVSYSGINLIGNSFTAAIPITSTAINLGTVVLNENTAYLFNMGTRDQWRKLNGGITSGVAAGQYQAVPFNLAGQAGIPDRVLSMHTLMLNVKTPGSLILKYDQLIKNELNTSTLTSWRSTTLRNTNSELPYIVMDVIGQGSADRVWLFEHFDASADFDNGWDGIKMKEGDLIQAYISGNDHTDYQIATVTEIEGTMIGIKTVQNENFTINMSVTAEIESRRLYLYDLFTGQTYPITDNAEYAISRTNASNINRFTIKSSSVDLIEEKLETSFINIYVKNNIIIVDNQTEVDCIATVYDLTGKLVGSHKVQKSETSEFAEISQIGTAIYIVRVVGENQLIYKTDKVILK